MKKGKIAFRLILVGYIVGIIFFSYTLIRSIRSPYPIIQAPQAFDLHNACIRDINQTGSWNPNCFKGVIRFDIDFYFSYIALHDYYQTQAKNLWLEGQWFNSVLAEIQTIYYQGLYFFSYVSFIAIWLGWVFLGGYLLFYKKFSSLIRVLLEGLITGSGISVVMYVISRWVIPGSQTLPTPLAILFLVYLAIWFFPDVWTQNLSTFIAKFTMLILSIVIFAALPLMFYVKLFVLPIISIGIAMGYYRWSNIPLQQTKTKVLIYITLTIGLFASLINYWDLLTSKIFIQDYDVKTLAEFIIDFVVFSLGFLLTNLETNKEGKALPVKETRIQETSFISTKTSQEKTVDPQKRPVLVRYLLAFLMAGTIFLIVSRSPKPTAKARALKH